MLTCYVRAVLIQSNNFNWWIWDLTAGSVLEEDCHCMESLIIHRICAHLVQLRRDLNHCCKALDHVCHGIQFAVLQMPQSGMIRATSWYSDAACMRASDICRMFA